MKGRFLIMRVLLRGLNVFCALALIGSVAATAMAQQLPVRVIQGSDGTLYVVQGNNSWTLVPDQASDSDVAALNPSGEIDGTLPDQLFVVQTPSAAPTPAPAPPQAQPPAQQASGCSSPITGTVDLTGKVASDFPGTCIAIGATVTSMVDVSTKNIDMYAIDVVAGMNYQVAFTSSNRLGNSQVNFRIYNPDHSGGPGCLVRYSPTPNCDFWSGGSTPGLFSPAVSGTYYPRITSGGTPTQRYTMTIKQVS